MFHFDNKFQCDFNAIRQYVNHNLRFGISFNFLGLRAMENADYTIIKLLKFKGLKAGCVLSDCMIHFKAQR